MEWLAPTGHQACSGCMEAGGWVMTLVQILMALVGIVLVLGAAFGVLILLALALGPG
jgi:hypothetical protein